MVHEDTCKLLAECDASIQMAVGTIDEVLPVVESHHLREHLTACKQAHEKIGDETHTLLAQYQAEGKAPSAVAKGMSWAKTNLRLAVQPGDQSVADLILDNCNYGIKTMHKFTNRYPDANPDTHTLVKRIIAEQEQLSQDLRSYL